MSRSDYSDNIDNWALIRWRGAVTAAIKGKQGQAFLIEMAKALDTMPNKRLISDKLISEEGEVCALGCVGKSRNLDMSEIDPEDFEKVSKNFGIAKALAREITFENDELYSMSPKKRWVHMRKWVDDNLLKEKP